MGTVPKKYIKSDGSMSCCSPFVTEAICEFYNPDRLYVLSTKEGLDNHFDDLEKRLLGKTKLIIKQEIPTPTREDEIWSFFQIVTEIIEPGDTIIFDITLGFRSIPMLALLVANLLRVARNVSIQALTYAEVSPNSEDAPVRDLLELVRLLEWTTATDAFLRYGRADMLVDLMRTTNSGNAISSATNELASTLETLTSGLQVSRPTEVQKAAYGLGNQVEEVRKDKDIPAPIGLLLDRISNEYTPLGHEVPTDPKRANEVLRGQAEIVAWYVKKGLYVQAITLTREWLVSWVIARTGGDLFAERDRALAESAVNGRRTAEVSENRRRVDVPVPQGMLDTAKCIKGIWNQTRDLRNDIGHTGMRPEPRRADKVVEQVTEVCEQLPQLLKDLEAPQQ